MWNAKRENQKEDKQAWQKWKLQNSLKHTGKKNFFYQRNSLCIGSLGASSAVIFSKHTTTITVDSHSQFPYLALSVEWSQLCEHERDFMWELLNLIFFSRFFIFFTRAREWIEQQQRNEFKWIYSDLKLHKVLSVACNPFVCNVIWQAVVSLSKAISRFRSRTRHRRQRRVQVLRHVKELNLRKAYFCCFRTLIILSPHWYFKHKWTENW